MSDDSVEFGGFGSTTPIHPSVKPKPKPKPKPRTTAKPLTKQRAGSTDQEPGPSKRPAGNATSRPIKRKKVENEIVLESEDEVEGPGGGGERLEAEVKETRVAASSDEDEIRVEVEEQLNRNGTKLKGRVNGRTQQQRGKPPSLKQSQNASKMMEVQASEEENMGEDVIHIDVPPPQQTRPGKSAFGKEKATSGRGQAKRKKEESAMDVDDVLEGQNGIITLIDKIGRPGAASSKDSGAFGTKDAELTKLKEKISRLESENKALSNQLEEQFRIRETEAEALLKRTDEQYQARVRALEEINQTLREQLVKKQPLAGLGNPSVLNFITREVADAEKQTLDKEIVKLKGEIDSAAKKLLEKDQEMGELKQIEKELRFELKTEIDRANAKQASRNAVPRSGMAEDPKFREAIKLYEDLTNIIVLNIRSTPASQGKKDEWQYTCCYTHTNESDSVNPITRSLSFTLRSYEQPDKNGLATDWIQYLPTSLDKEAEDFIQKLGFLNAPFQFERNQLALFLRTLYTTVEEIVKADDESDDGEPEQGAT